ncbi:hypothetical protein Csa_023548, partial [Cucumis sativus]
SGYATLFPGSENSARQVHLQPEKYTFHKLRMV